VLLLVSCQPFYSVIERSSITAYAELHYQFYFHFMPICSVMRKTGNIHSLMSLPSEAVYRKSLYILLVFKDCSHQRPNGWYPICIGGAGSKKLYALCLALQNPLPLIRVVHHPRSLKDMLLYKASIERHRSPLKHEKRYVNVHEKQGYDSSTSPFVRATVIATCPCSCSVAL
jgi:hypothetical protein